MLRLRLRRLWMLHREILYISGGFLLIGVCIIGLALLARLVSSLHAEWLCFAIGIILAMTGFTSASLFMFLTALRDFFGLRDSPEGYKDGPPDRKAKRRSRRQRKYIRRRAVWPATLIGMGESIAYPVAFLIEKPEFIGVWLAVKVAAQWSYWNDKPGEQISGRSRYHVFLFGNLLSIGSGYLTYLMVRAVIG